AARHGARTWVVTRALRACAAVSHAIPPAVAPSPPSQSRSASMTCLVVSASRRRDRADHAKLSGDERATSFAEVTFQRIGSVKDALRRCRTFSLRFIALALECGTLHDVDHPGRARAAHVNVMGLRFRLTEGKQQTHAHRGLVLF